MKKRCVLLSMASKLILSVVYYLKKIKFEILFHWRLNLARHNETSRLSMLRLLKYIRYSFIIIIDNHSFKSKLMTLKTQYSSKVTDIHF